MNKTIAGGEKIQKKIESQDNSKTEDPLREKKWQIMVRKFDSQN